MPTCLDHAGLTHPRALVPEEKRLGYVSDAWVNDNNDLVTISTVDSKREESDLLERSLKEGKRWGVSLYNRLLPDPETGGIAKIDSTHLGFTMEPALGGIGKVCLAVPQDPPEVG